MDDPTTHSQQSNSIPTSPATIRNLPIRESPTTTTVPDTYYHYPTPHWSLPRNERTSSPTQIQPTQPIPQPTAPTWYPAYQATPPHLHCSYCQKLVVGELDPHRRSTTYPPSHYSRFYRLMNRLNFYKYK